jgi:hypothetical protein
MASNWFRSIKSQMSIYSILCKGNIFGFCYHWVNGFSDGLIKRDPIIQHPLYLQVNGSQYLVVFLFPCWQIYFFWKSQCEQLSTVYPNRLNFALQKKN